MVSRPADVEPSEAVAAVGRVLNSGPFRRSPRAALCQYLGALAVPAAQGSTTRLPRPSTEGGPRWTLGRRWTWPPQPRGRHRKRSTSLPLCSSMPWASM
jgi:hypothetical protein